MNSATDEHRFILGRLCVFFVIRVSSVSICGSFSLARVERELKVQ
jgi:hypothetical protein